MQKRKLFTACTLAAAMMLQSFSIAGMDIKAVEPVGMITEDQLTGGENEIQEPESYGPVPNDEQRYYQMHGLAAFCHFGPNTYHNVEWGTGYGEYATEDLLPLQEDTFDADALVKMLQDAGFCKVMLTAKHHDGFCLWNSEVTDYSIGAITYSFGKRDILEELSDACTKYNMDMGLYLSPWDIHEEKYGCYGDDRSTKKNGSAGDGKDTNGGKDYQDLYVAQIREICTATKKDENGNELKDENGNPIYKYGNNNPKRRGTDRFVEWWMDGANSSEYAQTYDWKRIYETIREKNPNCQIFGTHMAGIASDGTKLGSTGGIHWIGNEEGYAHDRTWSKVVAGDNYERIRENVEGHNYIRGFADGDTWSVPECDAKLLSNGWFWGPAKQNSLRSMANLSDMYYRSVGHGSALLLNVSPNSDGVLDDAQKERLLEFTQAIKDSFAEDLTKVPGVTASASSVWGNSQKYSPMNVLDSIPEGKMYDDTYWSAAEGETTGTLEIHFPEKVEFNTVSIEEYIPKGQKITSFSVEYEDEKIWKDYASGETISSKRLCRGQIVETDAIRIRITGAQSTPMISNVGVYKTVESFAEEEEVKIPANMPEIGINDFTFTGEWGADTLPNGGAGKWSNKAKNGTAEFSFTGTQAWIFGTMDPTHGKMNVYVDDELVDEVDTSQTASRKMDVLLYTTPKYEFGEHTVRIVITEGAIGLSKASYLSDAGYFEVEQNRYTVGEGETVEVKIVRKDGNKGAKTISYVTPSAGAEQGVNYEYQQNDITFQDGEIEKTVVLKTTYSSNIADGLDFGFVISSDEAVIGVCDACRVVIWDKDYTEAQFDSVLAEAKSYLDMEDNYETEVWNLFKEAYQDAVNADESVGVGRRRELTDSLKQALVPIQEQHRQELHDELKQQVEELASQMTKKPDHCPEDVWSQIQEAYAEALKAVSGTDQSTAETDFGQLIQNLKEAQTKYAEWASKPVILPLSAPDVTGISSTPQGVAITFRASANSASYEIYRKAGNGQPVKIGTSQITSYVDEKPLGGQVLTYMVKAVSGDAAKYQSSSYGASKSVTLPKSVKKLKVKSVAGGAKITFKKVKGAKKYIIYRAKKQDGPYKKVKALKAKQTSFTDKKAKKGKNYYKVVVQTGNTYSPAVMKKVTIKK